MIIYKDILTDDEMFSDIYKIKESEHGAFYEVEAKHVCRTNAFDESLIGANASAEEQCEGTDESSVSGVDVVLNHKLQETVFTKKQFMTYLKGYSKAVVAKLEECNPERVEPFKDNLQKEIKAILADFKDFQFFTGESMNPEGMVALLNYRCDNEAYMLFFKDALVEEKC